MGHPDRPGGTAPHAVVPDVERPQLTAEDRHHLGRVRRLRDGDLLSVTDGAGRWRWCRFGAALDPVGEVVVEPAPAPALTIAFALVKGERPELVVQKLTELGVDRIVPFVADRSVVRWEGEREARNLERLRRIAREAACQSRRVWLPEVADVAPFSAVAALPGAVRADREGAAPSLARPTVLVGPEGGWSVEEVAAVPAAVALGPLVLRAETASVGAAGLLAALREGLVAERR